jgi:hypothetical protein
MADAKRPRSTRGSGEGVGRTTDDVVSSSSSFTSGEVQVGERWDDVSSGYDVVLLLFHLRQRVNGESRWECVHMSRTRRLEEFRQWT